MKRLFLLCGKVGSGKTTLANFLKEKYDTINFSADFFMLKLFGEIKDRNVFEEKLSLCKELIYSLCEQMFEKNDVVLDFGFWTKQEREYVKERLKAEKIFLIYLKNSDSKILKQIEKRNQNLKVNEYYIDKQTYDYLSSKFEEPCETENFIVYKDNQNLIKQINAN